jgi:prepilin-type N-terminal cleavage/methylation domain-containing protein
MLGVRLDTRGKGFTLIELLVVVAVIGILMSIMLPVFARAREKAKQAQCLSNIRQIGQAFWMYAADYDDRLPKEWNPDLGGNGGFDEALDPYLGSRKLWLCPSNPTKGVDANMRDEPHPRHYAMVSEVMRTAYPFGKYKAPSDTLLLAEICGKDSSGRDRSEHMIWFSDSFYYLARNGCSNPPNHYPKSPVYSNLNWDAHSRMGGNGSRSDAGGASANYLMFDTHARSLSWHETRYPRGMWTMDPND